MITLEDFIKVMEEKAQFCDEHPPLDDYTDGMRQVIADLSIFNTHPEVFAQ